MINSFLLLLTFCIFYVMIIEMFTVLFRLTGLTEEKARFEVISLLTSTGFSTTQSEVIARSKRRRELASITMIFGYVFSLIIVSIVVNLFLNMSNQQIHQVAGTSALFLTLFIVLFLIMRSRIVKQSFDSLINRICFSLSKSKSNSILILDVYNTKVMAAVHLSLMPKILLDTPLSKSGIKEDFNIQILVIKRNKLLIEHIAGDTKLQKNDDIVVFGKENDIKRFFDFHN